MSSLTVFCILIGFVFICDVSCQSVCKRSLGQDYQMCLVTWSSYSGNCTTDPDILQNGICTKSFKIAMIDISPYDYWMSGINSNYRSSHLEVFNRKGIFKNFIKLTEKHLCQSLFFNKVAGFRPATLLEKRLWHMYFPVNFL